MEETKSENLLPKTLPGAVCVQWVRCGKPTCRCARGELHGPYFYRFIWVEGRQRKLYVRRDEVAQAQTACQSHRAIARQQRAQRKADRFSLRSLLANLSEVEKLIGQWSGEETE